MRPSPRVTIAIALPVDFAGMSVLDLGCFDGFYAFVAERRAAEDVVAIDNEQYRPWVFVYWGFGDAGLQRLCADRRLLARGVVHQR